VVDLPELADGSIHVWKINSKLNADRDGWGRVLSAAEQDRAQRFRFEKDRQLYVAAHAALRVLLASYEGIDTDQLDFVFGARGKPAIAQPAASRIQFNLSHSHELALLAITRDRAVGIDVEHVRENFSFQEVARRFFTAREAAVLSMLPEALQGTAFYRCWTSKEAFLKAKGTGLSGGLDEVEIVMNAEGSIKILARIPGWSLLDLPQLTNYESALVVEGGAVPVKCYEWQPGIAAARPQ
jgi:4'-phosphopantetheinyl transferase